jgi:hypothetical protein
MLIAISLYSLGTLILVPDSNPPSPRAMEEGSIGRSFGRLRVHASAPHGCSPQACGGVMYSFRGFFHMGRPRNSSSPVTARKAFLARLGWLIRCSYVITHWVSLRVRAPEPPRIVGVHPRG